MASPDFQRLLNATGATIVPEQESAGTVPAPPKLADPMAAPGAR
jgi:hypothetical protein